MESKEIKRYRFAATSTGYNVPIAGVRVQGPVLVDVVIYAHRDEKRPGREVYDTYSVEINGKHQFGGFAHHLPPSHFPVVSFLVGVVALDAPQECTMSDGTEHDPAEPGEDMCLSCQYELARQEREEAAPVRYGITATIEMCCLDGWSGSKQVPYFELNASVQGIVSEEAAAEMAKLILYAAVPDSVKRHTIVHATAVAL